MPSILPNKVEFFNAFRQLCTTNTKSGFLSVLPVTKRRSYFISVSFDLLVANKGGQTNKKSTQPAKRKPKTVESDEDFIVSDDEEEKHLGKSQKPKTTSKKRTSNSIDSSDEDITPTVNKKAKRKSREIQSDSDDDYEPVRPEKSKPVEPVPRDVSSGSDEEVKPPSKVIEACCSLCLRVLLIHFQS